VLFTILAVSLLQRSSGNRYKICEYMRNIYMHLGKIILAAIFFIVSFNANAQTAATPKKAKVAVLLPLYLDSAFNGAVYRLGNNNIPKYILPGLEFYNGVMMAVDSLQKEGQPLEVMVHDTKSKEKSLNLLLVEPEIASASFIIGSFNTKEELKKVADFAAEKNIPLISATYPNDGGITANPNLVLINSTLSTHIEGVFKYVQRNHSLDNVVLFKRKSDPMDKHIMESIIESSKKNSAIRLPISYVEVSDVFNPQEIISKLDSNKTNVVIGSTLNETFAGNLVRTLSSIKASYTSVAIGMPTWDNMKELTRGDTRGVEVVYSTPYGFQKTDKLLGRIAASYKTKMLGRASDMVFKGYEAMYHFAKLYLKHGTSFMQNLSDKEFKIASEFDIEPVKVKKDNPSTDYLENKKLYFVTKLDGVVKSTR
jgi:ABC-type branched-subunit amino acid transport system substrate-binding protein